MIVGIDLGTTNSLVGAWKSNKVEIIPNALGKLLTPSVVSIDEKDGTILVGEPALHRLNTHPHLSIDNFKRYMGSDHIFKLGNLSLKAEELSLIRDNLTMIYKTYYPFNYMSFKNITPT